MGLLTLIGSHVAGGFHRKTGALIDVGFLSVSRARCERSGLLVLKGSLNLERVAARCVARWLSNGFLIWAWHALPIAVCMGCSDTLCVVRVTRAVWLA